MAFRQHRRVLFCCGNTKFVRETCTNALELERYEAAVPMTLYEWYLLRRWVISGHIVHDKPGSRYICIDDEHHPVSDFLDVYRMNREIRTAIKDMTPQEQEAYLKTHTN